MKEKDFQQIKSVLWSAAVSLTFFWKLNILKESFKGVKDFLNFFPSVGPLLGLFVFSVVVFLLAFGVFSLIKPKSQKLAFWVYLLSVVVFVFMVFPPVFGPIVALITGK